MYTVSIQSFVAVVNLLIDIISSDYKHMLIVAPEIN